MHICFISSEYSLWQSGGVGSFLQTFGRGMVKKGHRVTVIGMGVSKEEELLHDEGVEIIRLAKPEISYGKFLINTKRISARIKEIHLSTPIDIVESAELGLAFIKKVPAIKYVIRLHGGHHFFAESEQRKVHWWQGYKERLSFKNADGFVAVSDYVKSHTSKYLSYHNKPVEVINYPIDIVKFSPRPDSIIDKNNITFAGTVCEKKGIRQLIMAMKSLRERYPELHLHVYGRDWLYKDGSSYIEMLKREYHSITKTAVTFHGVIPFSELPEKYAKARVCVFPSHMETQGLVAPEAMAMEKPVVFSKLGPGPETIKDFETGLLCDPHNIEDIAEKISWFLSNSDNIETIGKQAKVFVHEKFNPDKIIDRNVDFYSRLVHGN